MGEGKAILKGPVFIHSLFRAGSTWIFDRFRRAGDGLYWCYQEPYHEELINLNYNPDSLLQSHGDLSRQLRHPALDKPYFYEFHVLRSELNGSFKKEFSFDLFFDVSGNPAFDEYTSRLITLAKGRPALQCCRTAGRIKHLKDAHGGTHIYLWRNPWDNWWSYQINYYFDLLNLAVLNAKNPPPVFHAVREEIAFSEVHRPTIFEELAIFNARPLSAEHRYLVFYALWCYALLENIDLVDIDLNIDRLSRDKAYREERTHALQSLGVGGLDFSNCASPQALYGAKDREFFAHVEDKVHQMFLANGYIPRSIARIQELRAFNAPPAEAFSSASLERDAGHARAVARRLMDAHADAAKLAAAHAGTLESVVGHKDNLIAGLEAVLTTKDGQLNAIYSSRAWKAVLIYYRLRDKIFPIGSGRRRFAKFIFHGISGSKKN